MPFKQAVEILHGCHKTKVFHGEIHLGNFLINKYGKMFIIDFGIGKTVKKAGFLSCNFLRKAPRKCYGLLLGNCYESKYRIVFYIKNCTALANKVIEQ